MAKKKGEMKIAQRLREIEALESVETPWIVKRVLGSVSIFGTNICIVNNGDQNDYVNLKEAQEAFQWVIEQLDGEVEWKS